MTYEQRLIAAGIPPQTARRDAWANEMQWLNNREAERYASEMCADGDAGINYREGFATKYGTALGAD